MQILRVACVLKMVLSESRDCVELVCNDGLQGPRCVHSGASRHRNALVSAHRFFAGCTQGETRRWEPLVLKAMRMVGVIVSLLPSELRNGKAAAEAPLERTKQSLRRK